MTRWAFLWQVLSADHSCGDAVARVMAWRAAAGLPACSSDTGSYCQARTRMRLGLVQHLLRGLGARLHAQGPDAWRWKGRSVKVVDGTTVSMPDTPENVTEPVMICGAPLRLNWAWTPDVQRIYLGELKLEDAAPPKSAEAPAESTASSFRELHGSLSGSDQTPRLLSPMIQARKG